MDLAEQYQRFITWQCKLRKQSMRELNGRPTPGMSAGVHSSNGGDEQCRLNFMINRRESQERTQEFRHIVRKSRDPSEWVKNGLRILSEWHYQEEGEFENELTALFNFDSGVASALLEAGQCHLKFAETTMEFAFDFDVQALTEESDRFQATYWHNHLFNPTLPGAVQVLEFKPRLLSVV